MNIIFASYPFRGLGLIFSMLAVCWFAGCCDGEVLVSGRILDAGTSETLDSVRVGLYRIDEREAHLTYEEYSDSLGSFLLWDFGYCGNEHFFISASKPGYLSQILNVEASGPELELSLDPD